MSTTTSNLGLTKPELSERYSLATWNGNSDLIDSFAGTVNTALAGKATAADITAAIADLDVSSKGGSGKYISEIKEVDGKIDATATTLSTAPTNGSSTAITSGAVYTALAGKASMADVFGLGNNTSIPNNANLNDYTTPGIYVRTSTNLDSGITNAPMDGTTYPTGAFKLIVEYVNGANNIRQTLIPLYADTSFFIRHRMTGANGTWRSWYYYSGTEVTS